MDSIQTNKKYKEEKKAQKQKDKRAKDIEKTKKASLCIKKKSKQCKISKRVNIPLKLLDDVLLNIIDEYKYRISGKIKLKNLCDSVYSDYIRFTKAVDGICTCITCGRKRRWNDTSTKEGSNGIQNGHYVSRGRLKYRFDDKNCYPQCWRCNVAMNGAYKEYTFKMEIMFGLEEVKRMEHDKEVIKISSVEYVEMIKRFYSYLPNAETKS